jgi:hypothetical protein
VLTTVSTAMTMPSPMRTQYVTAGSAFSARTSSSVAGSCSSPYFHLEA